MDKWVGGWVRHANDEKPSKTLLKKKRKRIQGSDFLVVNFRHFEI
jgi:hypothetical protein